MRRELMELFRDTRFDRMEGAVQNAAPATGRAEAPVRGTPCAPEPSRFLRRFLQRSSPTPEPARSGLAHLDRRLGGGFQQGLHLVLGDQTAGTTAFLESLAWEAVGTRRPALYYALKNGGLQVWERLIATIGALSHADGVMPLTPPSGFPVAADEQALARLDAELQASVFPFLSLFDRPSGPPGSLAAFIERVRSRSEEAAEQHGRLPLVIIDDLEELAAITGTHAPFDLMCRLDAALSADALPGVLTAGPDGSLLREVERLPVRTLVELRTALTARAATRGRVELVVHKNVATGWTGSLPLILDPASGLFAEVATG